jgi:hypothetical protein
VPPPKLAQRAARGLTEQQGAALALSNGDGGSAIIAAASATPNTWATAATAPPAGMGSAKVEPYEPTRDCAFPRDTQVVRRWVAPCSGHYDGKNRGLGQIHDDRTLTRSSWSLGRSRLFR